MPSNASFRSDAGMVSHNHLRRWLCRSMEVHDV